MLPDFNRLRVFYYIYLHKSVALAAKELHVTQSAVSQHLTKLEREIEIRLFTRLHKKLVPTLAGDRLFQLMRPFVLDLEGILQEIAQEKEGPSGLLRVGAPVEFGERYLPEVFMLYRRLYPKVRFQMELGHPTVLLPQLKAGLLDIVFADIFGKKGEFARDLTVFDIEPILDERLILVGSKSYFTEWNLSTTPTLKQLLRCDFIAYQPHAPAIRSWFKHHFKKETVTLSVALTVESVQAVISAVLQNMGLGLIPSHLIQDETDSGKIMKVQSRENDLINRISLVQLLDKIANPTEKSFIEFFKKHMTTIGLLE